MEQVRLIYAPTKVIRLAAIFALPSLVDAVAFRNQYQPTNIITKFSQLTRQQSPTIGDYAFAVASYPPKYFNAMFDYVRRYWVDPPHQVEMLFSCPMRVIAISNDSEQKCNLYSHDEPSRHYCAVPRHQSL